MSDKPARSPLEYGILILLLLAVAMLIRRGACLPAREEARRIRCFSNLNQLAKGMATYLTEHGDNRWYPCPLGRGRNPRDYNGAEWLASLYWTGVIPDPGVFLCPSTRDANDNGRHLGATRAGALFGSQTVSYAGLHYYSLADGAGNPRPSALSDDLLPDTPMASDDTQGTINHGTADNGGMCVLFGSHIDWKTSAEIDLEHGVGQKGGLLWRLRN